MSQEALDKGLGIVRKNYANTVSKGRLTQEQMDKRMGLLQGALSYDELKDVDIVIEAVFEDMAVKKQVFQALDKVCKPGAILATNTSTLDVNDVAAVTSRPADVLGLHFFSPANVMKLLEVVRAATTSKEVLATAMKLSRTIKKVGVVAGVCDGFIGNRMLHSYFREAGFLVAVAPIGAARWWRATATVRLASSPSTPKRSLCATGPRHPAEALWRGSSRQMDGNVQRPRSADVGRPTPSGLEFDLTWPAS